MDRTRFDVLPAAVRALAIPKDTEQRHRRKPHQKEATGRPATWLIVDTETRTNTGQGLTFGNYQYGRDDRTLQEGVFHADNLPESSPEEYEILREYVRTHPAHVSRGGSLRLRLYSRSDFVRKVLVPAINDADAVVVGLNLPFDLSRLSVGYGEARRSYEGGFSFVISDYEVK